MNARVQCPCGFAEEFPGLVPPGTVRAILDTHQKHGTVVFTRPDGETAAVQSSLGDGLYACVVSNPSLLRTKES